MRRMTAPLAQRVLFLSESQHLDVARIGQRLGLPIASVHRILHNREQTTISVPVTVTGRLKVHVVRQETHEGNGLGHFPKMQARKRKRNRRTE
jgi:hypothetical protein